MFAGKTRIGLFFILALIFILTVGSVLFIVQYKTNSIINELTLKQAQTANRSLKNFLSELKERVSMRAEVVAENEAVISAIKNNDYIQLRRLLLNFISGIDFISVCDSNGIVIARSINEVIGDDITIYNGISAVLDTGKKVVSMEQVQSVGNHLTIFSSVPVFDGYDFIGIVNCHYDLTHDDYLEVFKERAECEAAIFMGEECVAATLRDKENNIITGGKTFDFISKTVLRQRKEYTGILELYGKVYGVCYAPLEVEGNVIGMLFTGVDNGAILESQRSMNFWIITAAFFGILASFAFIYFSGKLINKLEYRTSVVENSPHIIFYSDAHGNINYANPAASATSGYTDEEIKKGGFTLLFDEETVKKIKNEYIPVTIKDGIARREAELICKDGSRRILNVTSFMVKHGVVAGIAMDLTAIRDLQNELIKAKNKAEYASRAKSEFLSNMSHEMRTPMNAIIGMAAIARGANDNERKNYALNKVEEASKHLLTIINDVLDMSKIEANKFELSEVIFDLRKMLQKAYSLVRFAMQNKKQRFSMNVEDSIPNHFIGDDQRLIQVITNLFSNAVKFTPENGSIGLNVTLVKSKHGVCELRFEVFDTGIGIPPDKVEKVFHMFEQAETGTTRKYGGTGLGLSISKHIIELMGGNIYVESEKGKGSRFIFNVKFLHMDEDATIGSLEEIDDKEDCASIFNGKKLLLVEDIEINREIIIAMLENTGLIIESAENGKEAVDKFKANPASYNIILMDIQMPVMDGLEATRLIREYERQNMKKLVPIVAMTANVFKDDINACIDAGMDDHIGKPVDKEIVMEKLRRCMANT